ncbi:hypothetical protein QKT26_gp86 [Carcinus maenas nudivirus]|uniref:Uncharacterized protein n=1 Tax=Carcinus maenas nudivirus TaxID=2880837 RepID=A0AAE8Y0Z3_9VIRU|nr:hypothetical protein QKT26_gp86 [Carcinus maenas nudivirus]UBZ25676.1 hypothetical protein CmNV_085 [Carcinus maenas nudivirus]
MSSLLTALIRKRYQPIDNLNAIFDINTKNISIHGDKLYEGNIHALYLKVTLDDYYKIYNYYNKNNMINNQDFVFYSNNKIGVMCYTERGSRVINNCEKWEFSKSTVYNYEDVDVAYTIDEVKERIIIPTKLLNNTSVRLNAYGNWCRFDGRFYMFLGSRILYNNHTPDLKYISIKNRTDMNCINLGSNPGKFTNIYNAMDVCQDYFILFRSVNLNEFILNKNEIKKILCSQKLEHLLCHEEDLLKPLI